MEFLVNNVDNKIKQNVLIATIDMEKNQQKKNMKIEEPTEQKNEKKVNAFEIH